MKEYKCKASPYHTQGVKGCQGMPQEGKITEIDKKITEFKTRQDLQRQLNSPKMLS